MNLRKPFVRYRYIALQFGFVLTSFILFSCSDQRTASESEIIRAFETGALGFTIEVETEFDGHSTVYRAEVTDRGSFRPILGSAVPSTEDPDIFGFTWSIDGIDVGHDEQLYFAFAKSDAYTIGVAVRLGSTILATARSHIDAEAIGAWTPGVTTYITLADPDSRFAVPGSIVDVLGDIESGGEMQIISESGGTSVLEPGSAGFFQITSRNEDGVFGTNVFVSPIPSVHVDRADRDWYYTQFRTHTTSNCGPSVVSMGIAWAIGQEVPVSTVRSHIGWEGTGAVAMGDLSGVLDRYGVENRLHWIESPREIMDMIDRDHLVGVVYDMAGISFTENAGDNLFGQYYVDSGGHYLMIKGYTLDREYFVVYDPIPSDWIGNMKRYADGQSMFGRNRYYDADELFTALRSPRVLEIISPESAAPRIADQG